MSVEATGDGGEETAAPRVSPFLSLSSLSLSQDDECSHDEDDDEYRGIEKERKKGKRKGDRRRVFWTRVKTTGEKEEREGEGPTHPC